MDQLKAQLAVVMKYGFWIGATLILLGSLGIWYMSTSQLAEENDSQTTKIKSAIQTVSSVQSELATHPNETSHQEMQRLIEGRQKEVLDAWQTLYDRQRSILTWPEKELGKDFVKEFKDLIPIEAIIEHPTPEEKEKQTFYLDRYQRYIKNVLPSIAKIADAEWTAQFEQTGGAGMMEMGMGMNTGYGGATTGAPVGVSGLQEGPLVKWSSGSQQALLSDLFPWRGAQPSTLEVYYSQENLWILKQLLQIIDDVNGDARQPYQAKIHEINKIGIGKSVQFGAGTISKPGARTGGMGMGMGGMDMMMDMDMSMSMDMEMSMDMGGGAVVEKPDPADNRYVNASMEPITGAELRSALTGNSPTTASLAVAKRVPVMMSLAMDQRAIHQLIAACGSAPLMVEVKQVRVLPQKAGGAAAGGMGGGMDMGMDMGMGDSMDMGMGGMGGGGYGGGMAAAGPTQPEQEFPFDMTVEIYGLIYIYNPPDREKLGLDKVTEDTVIDGDTETVGGQPVAPPASAAPAPATPTPATPAPAAPADGQLPPPTVPGPATPGPTTPTTPAPSSPTPPASPAPGDATPPADQSAPAAAPPVAATPTAPPAAIATPLAP